MRRFLAPAVAAALLPLVVPGTAEAAVVCAVSGSVSDAAGAALPGVSVQFMNASGNGATPTQADGTFAADAVCGTAAMTVFWQSAPAAGLPSEAWLRADVTVTDGRRFDLRLPAVVSATVRATTAAGAPVADALLHPTDEENEFDANSAPLYAGGPAFSVRVFVPNSRTDANGSTTLRTFPDSDMNLSLEPPVATGLQTTDFVLNASAATTRTVVLPTTPPGTPLAGVVRDSVGRGVPGAYVYRSGTTRGTNANAAGEFTTYGPAGTAGLTVSNGGDAYPRLPATPDVPGEFRVEDIPVTTAASPVTVTLPPVAHVRLTVVSSTGSPVSYATLTFAGGSQNAWVTSDPAVLVPGTAARTIATGIDPGYSNFDGQIAFNVFRSAPLSGIRVEHSGSETFVNLPPLDLRSDQDLTVRLPKAPTKAMVTGTLLDADGKAVQGTKVISSGGWSHVDANGRFSLAVNEGEDSPISIYRSSTQNNPGWTVQPALPDSFWADVPIKVDGPTEVALQLPRVQRLTVRVLDPDTRQPFRGAHLFDDCSCGMDVDNLTVSGAAGPARVNQSVGAGPANADGELVYRTWKVTRAPELGLTGERKGLTLLTRILDLEIAGDKTLELALGGQNTPLTYRPPTPVRGVSAVTTAVRTSAQTAAGSVTAAVAWTAPNNNGGLPVSGYRVAVNPGGRVVTVDAKARSASVGGLTPGAAYSFTVQAVNRIGRAKSATVKLDVAAPKATVTGPGATAKPGKVKLTWTATDDASGVRNYDVRVRESRTGKSFGNWTRVLTGSTATKYRLPVAAGRTYCVSVRARDNAGHRGAWSASRCVVVNP